MKIKGKFIQNLPPTSGTSQSGKEWQRGGFVIETEGEYPQKVAFVTFDDKVNITQNIPPNTTVEVDFTPRSHEFNGNWYTTLNCFAIAALTPQTDF